MNPKTIQITRWIARVLAAIMAALILFIFIGEAVVDGIGPLSDLSLRETLMMVAFSIVVLGLILGWLHEILGGWFVVLGMAAFYFLDLAFSGTFPRGITFALILLPGVLYLVSGYASLPGKVSS